jgi:hypothetical protein
MCNTVSMKKNKDLAAWLRKRLNKGLVIDNWQRAALENLLKNL